MSGLGGGGASYNNPASLLNITPEIVDRLFNLWGWALENQVGYRRW